MPMPSSTSPQPRLPLSLLLPLLLSSAALTSAQAACYWAAGPQYRLPESAGVVPCDENGYSACCKLGDICLAGNACYNFETDDTYQYGCSDPSYKDPSCPFKCDWNPDASPWVALEYCPSFNGINDTWTCQSPESCGCEWRSTYSLLQVPIRDCQAMGSNARVAIYATNTLPAYLILPQTYGGSTQYFSKGQTGNTPIGGYTPTSIGPFTSLSMATEVVIYDKTAVPAASYGSALLTDGSLPPIPTTPTVAPTSDPLGGKTSTTYLGSSYPTTSTTSSTSSTTSSGIHSNGHTSSSSGLSSSSKIGLGVGLGVGILLLIALVIGALFLRRRKAKQTAAATMEKKEKDYYDPYNLGGEPSNMAEAPFVVQEAPFSVKDEAIARKRMSPNGLPELDAGPEPIHELDGTSASSPFLTPNPPYTSH